VVIDDDIKGMVLERGIVAGLGIDHGPFRQFPSTHGADAFLLDIQQPDQGQVVGPINGIDMENFHFSKLSPEQPFQGQCTGHGVGVGVDDNAQAVVR
jgi:hypothetical protein